VAWAREILRLYSGEEAALQCMEGGSSETPQSENSRPPEAVA
jgi:hypothetical protein